MGDICLPSKLAALAAEVEEEGIAFYGVLSKRAAIGNNVNRIFLTLSEQEKAHRKTFLKIAEALKQDETTYEFPVNVGNLLQISIDKLKRTLFALNTVDSGPIDMKKSLAIAIRTEAESVKAYTAMEEKFPDKFTQMLEKIIAEENKHLDTLLKVKDRLDL
ncbi:MAG: hypothetical protein A3G33_04970 [Omnitrophica bacterium RIFCSPLOWO2_12_FULL_44_17]|uniref:Rubrerythrin diiron-binding domain-containing protein n=1 Tax=Candidatus Danuiimicrobium aquiferis TaxID=1801832 RepID=A0A1G1KXL7_9BACT|nr:MAG: hypothetical protein A3B72_02395 [Omnitrophica bacterium RIFCSPHIGHO2_02_FULL_45_28]OGW89192.1 MAG: hypothetical protein A3E74_07910 [Omnitrophica bacterium RIFCSPHIGHO2_12_FULL_44_12]OGW97645.1 MAG: hypothetical protein A3G33_04970 [Omnitrophica bacterium RIFCSPLOWO2_12_FULL_44_17]OGX04641.1 MAG: hypothetical protein A3J12_09210 [Omnitrophica bacterium RIFCSPLOWO2_02_FULL_44_11]